MPFKDFQFFFWLSINLLGAWLNKLPVQFRLVLEKFCHIICFVFIIPAAIAIPLKEVIFFFKPSENRVCDYAVAISYCLY